MGILLRVWVFRWGINPQPVQQWSYTALVHLFMRAFCFVLLQFIADFALYVGSADNKKKNGCPVIISRSIQ